MKLAIAGDRFQGNKELYLEIARVEFWRVMSWSKDKTTDTLAANHTLQGFFCLLTNISAGGTHKVIKNVTLCGLYPCNR